MSEKTGYEKLVQTDCELKKNKYVLPHNNSFYNEVLRVSCNGNVYIVDSKDYKENFSADKVSKLIAAKR